MKIQADKEHKKSLLQLMQEQGIYLSAPCGGSGTCGKCKVMVLDAVLPLHDGGKSGCSSIDGSSTQQYLSEVEKAMLTDEEQNKGIRLACQVFPKASIEVQAVQPEEEKIAVLAGYGNKSVSIGKRTGPFYIAIDIGTTTIAMVMIDKATGEVVKEYTSLNHQRTYGADVISRIQKAISGSAKELQEKICSDIVKGIFHMMENLPEIQPRVERVAIAGNTVMLHLLLGHSCKPLGSYPFQTPFLKEERVPLSTLLKHAVTEDTKKNITSGIASMEVVAMPGFSAFVGSDIVSDMLACGMWQEEKCCFLLDIGTNGEMAVGNRERILVASTAAGPAFEGGNIRCGVGSIPGAICGLELERGSRERGSQERCFLEKDALERDSRERDVLGRGYLERAVVKSLHRIGGQLSAGSQEQLPDRPEDLPVGICGTGLIEAAYELLQCGLMDETGLLEEPYFTEGFFLEKSRAGEDIRIFQEDIRQLQMAKGAVRSGIETLLAAYGIQADGIDKVLIAGGFGNGLQLEKAAAIGLFPKEWLDRISLIGNGALKGAVLYGGEDASLMQNLVAAMKERTQEIVLADDERFQEQYIASMNF